MFRLPSSGMAFLYMSLIYRALKIEKLNAGAYIRGWGVLCGEPQISTEHMSVILPGQQRKSFLE